MLGISRRVAIVNLFLSAMVLAGPNVLVVLTDDQGYGDVSAHGNPHLKTPAMDGLRREATAMDRFFVSPTCAPTRAALMTGRHEFAAGVSHTNSGRSLLRPGLPTLAEAMQGGGYETGIFGKWHLGDSFPCRPEDRGFDEIFVHGGGGIGQTPDFWGNGYFDPMIRRKSGWVATEGYCTDVFFSEATIWMEKQVAAKKPFFLWLATNAPHAPFVPPKGKAEAFREKGLEEPLASFYAMIENIDENLEELLKKLKALGIEEETIVIFMTDNGSKLPQFNAGMKGSKGSPDEGGVRVPFFIRWPEKINAGAVIKTPGAHVDVMPTLASLCEVSLPDEWVGDGLDLSSALLGEKEFPSTRSLFTHLGRWPGDERPERFRTKGFSVRDERWRLVGLELFDMQKDPGQEVNVFEEHAAEATRLLTDYGRWWDSVLPAVRQPVRPVIGSDGNSKTELTAHDWWPSRETNAENQNGVWSQKNIRSFLDKARMAGTRNALAGTSGHWKLLAEQAGNYRIRMSLLPRQASKEDVALLAKLRPGTAHVRAGQEEVQLKILEGATEVTVLLDLDAGPIELEAWFEGQLLKNRKLGAFFVEIERLGERKRSKAEFLIEEAPEE
ncbi:arylsulfatase [Haloferula sp.]|uniref:arylsulfatase n=1 Tax=Haloferula sp. TaxID=2497595 RepID=UPI00329E5014